MRNKIHKILAWTLSLLLFAGCIPFAEVEAADNSQTTVTVTNHDVTMNVDDTIALNYSGAEQKVNMGGTTITVQPSCYWKCMDPSVVVILDPTTGKPYTSTSTITETSYYSKSCLIRADKPGKTMIYARESNTVTETWTITVNPKTLPITSVAFADAEVELIQYGYTYLRPTVLPAELVNPKLTYTSNDPSIATVNQEGRVDAISNGTTMIQARADNGVYATCKISVIQPVTSVRLNIRSKSMKPDDTCTLKTTISPSSGVTSKKMKYTSNDESVAKVSSSGKITAVGGGKARIKVVPVVAANANVYDYCDVTVTEKVSSVSLNKSSLSLTKGKTYHLKASVKPSTANNRKVSYTSSNPYVATVSSSGKVTAQNAGSATITCRAKDGSKRFDTCRVKVIPTIASLRLNRNSGTIEKGKAFQLKVSVSPTGASKSVKWKSSNEKVATVDSRGVVTTVAAGSATITATSTVNTNRRAVCKVKVTDSSNVTLTLNNTDLTLAKGTSKEIGYRLTPGGNNTKCTFVSSNEGIASVSSNGTVTARQTGNATITVTTSGGKTAKCQVEVVALSQTSIQAEQYDMPVQLTLLNRSDTVAWTSSNSNVATVSQTGSVSAKSAGTAVITAAYKGIKLTCKITVRNL